MALVTRCRNKNFTRMRLRSGPAVLCAWHHVARLRPVNVFPVKVAFDLNA